MENVFNYKNQSVVWKVRAKWVFVGQSWTFYSVFYLSMMFTWNHFTVSAIRLYRNLQMGLIFIKFICKFNLYSLIWMSASKSSLNHSFVYQCLKESTTFIYFHYFFFFRNNSCCQERKPRDPLQTTSRQLGCLWLHSQMHKGLLAWRTRTAAWHSIC